MKSVLLCVLCLVACLHPAAPANAVSSSPPSANAISSTPAPAQRGAVTLSSMGTNDLHGALERLPLLAGFVANLRAARAVDGGGVLLLDGGDMFHGTLESNYEGKRPVACGGRPSPAGQETAE